MFTDNFSKRFLAICLGLSVVLCSGSLLIWTVTKATAETPGQFLESKIPANMQSGGGFGLGITNTHVYYGFSADDGTYIYKVELSSPKIKTWD